jgi:hypothetical protein
MPTVQARHGPSRGEQGHEYDRYQPSGTDDPPAAAGPLRPCDLLWHSHTVICCVAHRWADRRGAQFRQVILSQTGFATDRCAGSFDAPAVRVKPGQHHGRSDPHHSDAQRQSGSPHPAQREAEGSPTRVRAFTPEADVWSASQAPLLPRENCGRGSPVARRPAPAGPAR